MKFLNSIQTVWQLICGASQGTPPLQVTSTTKVTNLNCDKLDDQEGSYYLDYNNFTNKPTFVVNTSQPSAKANQIWVNTNV